MTLMEKINTVFLRAADIPKSLLTDIPFIQRGLALPDKIDLKSICKQLFRTEQ